MLDSRGDSKVVLKDKSLIIFDWDGTLMDSIGLIIQAMHVASQAHGLSTSDEKVKSIIGLSLIKGIEILFPEATREQQLAIQQSYADFYIAASSASSPSHSHFFVGIETMLQKLLEQGKKLAVATGKKRAGLDRVMSVSNSEHYFISTRCADESGSKPNPKMLLEILAETGYKSQDAVFIGDSIHDIKMANNISMTSIAVNYGAGNAEELAKEQPTFQVDTPQQLINLLTSS